MKKIKKKNKNLLKYISIFLIVFSVIILAATNYYRREFNGQEFETLLFNVKGGIGVANLEVVFLGIKREILFVILLSFILMLPLLNINKFDYYIDFSLFKWKKSLHIFPFKKNLFKFIYSIIILLLVVTSSLERIGFFEYLKAQINVSTIFEEEYVDTKKVEFKFPHKKRNLIYIFMESMESSLFTLDNGGGYKYSLVPELENIALNNTNFSGNEKLGGAKQVYAVGWTAAGMIAQTTGIPLKVHGHGNTYHSENYLKGCYSLGDILRKEGYNLEIMMGSDATYAGRNDFYRTHGNYEIFDVNEAISRGKMKEEDKVWWGFSDDDLFKWSKEEILKLSKKEEPFNYIMLTADTHFTDGYLSKNAPTKFNQQYENVFAYSSKLVSEFLDWLKKQDFYKNTTVVILGDHLGMQAEFYEKNLIDGYERRVFNTIINPVLEPKNNKNRLFCTMDIFPTVLASIGVQFEGDRLGLGTNLYSGRKTLLEEMGFEKFNTELTNRSNYYIKNIIKDDYQAILEIED